jgi:hypothetical protein
MDAFDASLEEPFDFHGLAERVGASDARVIGNGGSSQVRLVRDPYYSEPIAAKSFSRPNLNRSDSENTSSTQSYEAISQALRPKFFRRECVMFGDGSAMQCSWQQKSFTTSQEGLFPRRKRWATVRDCEDLIEFLQDRRTFLDFKAVQ